MDDRFESLSTERLAVVNNRAGLLSVLNEAFDFQLELRIEEDSLGRFQGVLHENLSMFHIARSTVRRISGTKGVGGLQTYKAQI